MKTYLPYFLRKIALAVFFLFFIFTSLSGIDDFIAGFNGAPYPQRENSQFDQTELIFTFQEQDTIKWIGLVGSIISLLVYVLSKEKVEDEFLARLRADSMVKAVACSWGFYFAIKPLNWTNQFEGLVILQLQILAYVLIYTYQKKWKYWA